MEVSNNLKTLGLSSPLNKADENLYFSLVDYRNNYFTNNDPASIIEFYNGFGNRDQLIQWMRERPKGVPIVREVEGDKEIIVVIPTADFNGVYARECRENIFRGLHIVFVGSGGKADFYFNFAHYVNFGIKKAMEYNPKWVVFSSDDMVKIDTIKVLQEQLLALDNKRYDVIFTEPSKYHSSLENISKPNFLYFLYYKITNKHCGRAAINLYKKFEIRYLMSPVSGKFSKLFKKGYLYLEIQDFGIYSSIWISKMGDKIYDDTFINAAEDTDLSLIIALGGIRTAKIKYRIGDLIGSSLGTGIQRSLRSIAGLTYLNYKWRDHIMDPVTYRQHEHGETIK
jgi:hypothetical protein